MIEFVENDKELAFHKAFQKPDCCWWRIYATKVLPVSVRMF